MGSDFYKEFESVRKDFQIVDETLGFSLSKIILDGSVEDLKMTQNTQPAIMIVSVSIFNIPPEDKIVSMSRVIKLNEK